MAKQAKTQAGQDAQSIRESFKALEKAGADISAKDIKVTAR